MATKLSRKRREQEWSKKEFWESRDPHTLTSEEIAAGQFTHTLLHSWIVGVDAFTAYINGSEISPSNYELDVKGGKVTVSLAGWETTDDDIRFYYAFKKGPPPQEVLTFIVRPVGPTENGPFPAPYLGYFDDYTPVIVGSPPQLRDLDDSTYGEIFFNRDPRPGHMGPGPAGASSGIYTDLDSAAVPEGWKVKSITTHIRGAHYPFVPAYDRDDFSPRVSIYAGGGQGFYFSDWYNGHYANYILMDSLDYTNYVYETLPPAYEDTWYGATKPSEHLANGLRDGTLQALVDPGGIDQYDDGYNDWSYGKRISRLWFEIECIEQ